MLASSHLGFGSNRKALENSVYPEVKKSISPQMQESVCPGMQESVVRDVDECVPRNAGVCVSRDAEGIRALYSVLRQRKEDVQCFLSKSCFVCAQDWVFNQKCVNFWSDYLLSLSFLQCTRSSMCLVIAWSVGYNKRLIICGVTRNCGYCWSHLGPVDETLNKSQSSRSNLPLFYHWFCFVFINKIRLF